MSFTHLKRINVRKILYFPHLFSHEEKRSLFLFSAVALLSIAGLISRIYLGATNSVATAGGGYTEGVIGEPRAINPLYSTRDTERDIERLVFSGLLRYNEAGTIQTDLAERYEISPDGKIYTAWIRPNAVWHDDRPVTADDVVFTIRTIQNAEYQSPLRTNWQGVAVEKIDDHAVRFVLRNAYAPFIENLTLGLLPKHLWESVAPEQALLHDLNLEPIGSGPYRFSVFQKNNNGTLLSYTLTRNTRYYREGPYIKTMRFSFFESEEDVFNAWRRGKIDGFGPVPARYLAEIRKKRGTLYSLFMPRIFGIFFNQTQSKPLADKNVRQAIEYAIDRKEIAENAPSGGLIPKDSALAWLGSEIGGSPAGPHDPEKAKEILEKAGWKMNSEGIRTKKNAAKKSDPSEETLSFTLVTSDWPDLANTAERIKTQLKEVGIEIRVEKMLFEDLEANVIRPRHFDMLLFGEVYGYEPDPFAFWHSSQTKHPGLNIALYSNKKADAILEEARKTNDPDLRIKKYENFSKILEEDRPAIFLFSQLYFYLLPTDLQGVKLEKISLPADRFNTIQNWYRATKRVWK